MIFKSKTSVSNDISSSFCEFSVSRRADATWGHLLPLVPPYIVKFIDN